MLNPIHIVELTVDIISLAPKAAEIVSLALEAAQEVLGSTATEFVRNFRAYGLIRAVLLHSVLQQARHVIRGVNLHVVDAPTDQAAQASSLRVSYVARFNMVAVAVSSLQPTCQNCCSFTLGRDCRADRNHSTIIAKSRRHALDLSGGLRDQLDNRMSISVLRLHRSIKSRRASR